jgi:hypothetical protein
MNESNSLSLATNNRIAFDGFSVSIASKLIPSELTSKQLTLDDDDKDSAWFMSFILSNRRHQRNIVAELAPHRFLKFPLISPHLRNQRVEQELLYIWKRLAREL